MTPDFYSEISWPLDVLTDAHMTYYSMTAKSESDCCQTDLHFDPNYQYDLSNEKEQIDAKRVHPNVHKIYSLGLYLCTNRYILDKSWKQHRWHVQSFHHCYRIGSHCSSSFPFTRMNNTKYYCPISRILCSWFLHCISVSLNTYLCAILVIMHD